MLNLVGQFFQFTPRPSETLSNLAPAGGSNVHGSAGMHVIKTVAKIGTSIHVISLFVKMSANTLARKTECAMPLMMKR